MLIRTSVKIGGSRLSDHDFSSVSLDQRIGGHHTFQIRLSQNVKKDVLLEKTQAWIGETVSLGFDYHKDVELDAIPIKEIFKGIVTSIELSRRKGTGEIVVKGQSPTILMDDGPMTQSFTDTGLQEIVDKVMKPYSKGFPKKVTISPQNHSASIDYTVQYQENAFNFINRLANKYGEWFFYDGLDMYFGEKSNGREISLDFGDTGLNYFDIALKASPVQLELRAYDYRGDETITKKVADNVPSNTFGKEVLKKSKNIFSEQATHTLQNDLQTSELDQIAKRSAATATEQIVVLSGASSNCFLVPGAVVDIQDKSLGEKFGKYFVTSVTHEISQGGDYSNNFQAIPNEVKMPPYTAKAEAPFCETQIGKVSAVDDPDALGRVQVKLQWQEDSTETTPWIRVTSPYTGKDKGFYVIPEVGDQVLVSFEDNNPAKPYVLASIYHGKAKPELFNRDNDIKGFKSREENKLHFNDKEKSILLSASEKLELFAKKEISIETGSSGKIKLDAGNGTVTIIAKTVNVEAADAVNIKADKDLALEGSMTVDVKAGMDLKQKATNITTKADLKLENSGTNLDLKGTAMVNLQGAMVKIN